MARQRQIDPATYGNANSVTAITVARKTQFGGFEAWLVGGQIWVAATNWKGYQPRIVLETGEPGHADWLALLEKAPVTNTAVQFVGSAEAATNPQDQWLTSGPSALLS